MKNLMKRIADRVRSLISNKYFRRFAPLAIVLIIAVVTFATCFPRKGIEPEPEPAPSVVLEEPPLPQPSDEPTVAPPSGDPDPEPEEDAEPEYEGPYHPLTGLPTETDYTDIRPLAIMINNAPDAQPQLGVSRADIIYEVPVEGGRTRMLALYQDVSDVGVIGSIRSSRAYYIDIVQNYDAVYIFAGGSPEAYTILSNRNTTRLDGVNGRQTQIFYRDRQRAQTMVFEHTLVSSGELITRWLPTYNFRLEHENGFDNALSFTDDGTPADGAPALEFTVRFSSGKTTSFSYLAADSLYYAGQFGRSYKDGNDDTQLAFTNVLILKTAISRIAGDSEGRMRIATIGSGDGYFVCGGQYVEINWSRADATSQFSYTVKDGSELVFGRGRTYICIVPNDVNVDFS